MHSMLKGSKFYAKLDKASNLKQIKGNQSVITRVAAPYAMHRMLGNHGVQRFVQAKLKIGQANDKYEQEADRVADHVMRSEGNAFGAAVERGFSNISRSKNVIQRKCAACAAGNGLCAKCAEREIVIQRKPISETLSSIVQRETEKPEDDDENILRAKTSSGHTLNSSASSEAQIYVANVDGQPLPTFTRAFFESRFGWDFSSVRVHTDRDAHRSARGLNARAFTLGNNIVFGSGQYAPHSYTGKKLIAHELTHTLQQAQGSERIQRAETDDNPQHCFPTGGTPLQDSASRINAWVRVARARSRRDAIHMVNAVYQELASGGSVSEVERRLGALPSTHVNHVDYGSSRYSGTLMWPVDPLTRSVLWAAGKIFVAPVINLCGTCVGTDKVGHFFQQGYEYFRLYRSVEARIQAMPEDEQRAFYRRIVGPPIHLPDLFLDIEMDDEPFGLGRFEVTPAAIVEFAASAFVMQFGQWLEGFNNTLTAEDVRWINTHSFIPFYYHQGVYGASTTGVLSRADFQANRMGFQFYQDLWHNPSSTPNICDYVGSLWNEYSEINTVVPSLGTPRGPFSESRDVETP